MKINLNYFFLIVVSVILNFVFGNESERTKYKNATLEYEFYERLQDPFEVSLLSPNEANKNIIYFGTISVVNNSTFILNESEIIEKSIDDKIVKYYKITSDKEIKLSPFLEKLFGRILYYSIQSKHFISFLLQRKK